MLQKYKISDFKVGDKLLLYVTDRRDSNEENFISKAVLADITAVGKKFITVETPNKIIKKLCVNSKHAYCLEPSSFSDDSIAFKSVEDAKDYFRWKENSQSICDFFNWCNGNVISIEDSEIIMQIINKYKRKE